MDSLKAAKVSIADAIGGNDGQLRLAAGAAVGLRMWQNEEPGPPKPASTRPYEVVGYVLAGRAEVDVDGMTLALEPGDSWTIPAGASHVYRILSTFSALEATAPPAP